MNKMFKEEVGFTLIEIIAVLVVLGILAVVAVSRSFNYDVEVRSGADTLEMHLRYAQTLAMNSYPSVWGISSSGSSYKLFGGTNTSNINYLPEDATYINADRTVNLAAKKISISNFTIYFDNRGIPYTAYNATSNTPLAANLPITVTALSGGTTVGVTITPLTGYIP